MARFGVPAPGQRCIGRPVCETRSMDESFEAVTAEAVAVLRQAGARFAYLHGSRAAGRNRADSDIDIAAYFGGRPPSAFDVLLPPGWTCSSSTTRRSSWQAG